MRFTKELSIALSLLSAAQSLPHQATVVDPAVEQWRGLGSVAKSTWKSFTAAALGWYDVASMEAIEDVMDIIADAEPEQSVYQWLKANEKFSKISKLIDIDEETVKLLDGASHGLTFLAPNNDALPDHHHKKDLKDVGPYDDDLLEQLLLHADDLNTYGGPDDEKRKKMLKAILHSVLLYHALPYDVKYIDLGLNSTVPTAIIPSDGSFDGEARRLKIEYSLIPPTIKINKYAKIVSGDNRATNGLVHELDHPLFPPPSVLNAAFLWPQGLSTFTSAIQKVKLQEAVDYHYVKSEGNGPKFSGAPAITVFAPTNGAFSRLPEKLILYLFSPFGARALKKLLAFHVLPQHIVHTEWIHEAKSGKKAFIMDDGYERSENIPTALANYSLPITVSKSFPTIPVPGVSYVEIKVLGQKVANPLADIPARNGAFHIITHVLNPHKVEHDHHDYDGSLNDDEDQSWDDWEDWLPTWAQE